MYVVRPINLEDTESFINMAFRTSVGITSLPKDSDQLNDKVKKSKSTFENLNPRSDEGLYLFVLEDLTNHTLGGVCGILAGNNRQEASYYFEIKSSPQRQNGKSFPILDLFKDIHGPSELCSLYLFPEFRHGGLGKLLSFSRFLFITAFRNRFQDSLMAVMRGIIDNEGRSPFWESIGGRLCPETLEKVLILYSKDKKSILPYLPQFPIYVALLPPEAQAVIGKAHPHTQPAMEMLLEEGFTFSYQVDVFDGGPKIVVPTGNIRSIRESKKAKVVSVSNEELEEGDNLLISNNEIDFRACFAHLKVTTNEEVILSESTAKALNVESGSTVLFTHLRHHHKREGTNQATPLQGKTE